MPTPAQAIFLANGFAQECLGFRTRLWSVSSARSQVEQSSSLDPKEDDRLARWLRRCLEARRARSGMSTKRESSAPFAASGAFRPAPISRRTSSSHSPIASPPAFTRSNPHAHIFIEAEPFMPPPPSYDEPGKMVYAPHFYDGIDACSPAVFIHISILISSASVPLFGERTTSEAYLESAIRALSRLC